MKRKLLSVLLCLSMALTLLPVGVFAEDQKPAPEAAEKTDGVKTGGTTAGDAVAITADTVTLNGGYFKVSDNVTLEKSLIVPKDTNVTLDLNEGKTLTLTKNPTKDEIADSSAGIIVYGTLTITGKGTITGALGELIIVNGENAKITVTGGTIENKSTGNNGYGIFAVQGGTVEIAGDTKMNTVHAAIHGDNTDGALHFTVGGNAVLTAAKGAAIFQPTPVDVTVKENATINGGIFARMGDIHITGNAKILNTNPKDHDDSFLTTYAMDTGNIWAGDGIYFNAGTYGTNVNDGDNSLTLTIDGSPTIEGHWCGIAVYKTGKSYSAVTATKQDVKIEISGTPTIRGGVLAEGATASNNTSEKTDAFHVYTPDNYTGTSQTKYNANNKNVTINMTTLITGGTFSDNPFAESTNVTSTNHVAVPVTANEKTTYQVVKKADVKVAVANKNGTLTATVTAGSLDVDEKKLTFQWKGSGIAIENQTTSTYTVPEGVTGSYTVTATLDGTELGTSASVTVTAPAKAPTASPAAGLVTYDQAITLTAEGATIYYTTDGSTPTTSSTKYVVGAEGVDAVQPKITKDTTVKAIAVKEGMDPSPVAEFKYTVLPAPVFTSKTDTYATPVKLGFADPGEDVKIYYKAATATEGQEDKLEAPANPTAENFATEYTEYKIDTSIEPYKAKTIVKAIAVKKVTVNETEQTILSGVATVTYKFNIDKQIAVTETSETDTSALPGTVTEEDKTKVETALDTTKVDVPAETIKEVIGSSAVADLKKTASDTTAAAATKALTDKGITVATGTEPRVVVQIVMKTSAKAFNTTDGIFTVDIKPVARVVATTETDDSAIKTTGDSKNAVVISSEQKVDIKSDYVKVDITIPEGILADENATDIWVKHTLQNGWKLHHATGSNKVFSFNNKWGFSDFTVTKTAPCVAVIENDPDNAHYDTLQAAVNAAKSGDTILILQAPAEGKTLDATVNHLNGKVELTIKPDSYYLKDTDVADLSKKIVLKGRDNKALTATEAGLYTIEDNGTAPSGGGGGGGGSSSSTTVQSATGGKVTTSPSNPRQGDTVTLTPKPNDGYEIDTIVVKDSKGKEVTVTRNSDGTFSFTMPAGRVTITPTFKKVEAPAPASQFTDVSSNDWFAKAAEYVTDKGIMTGVGGGKFAPQTTTSRAMLVQMLYALEGKPFVSGVSFFDVASGDWFASAAAWASANGIVTGVGDGKFGPNQNLTREQMALILYGYAKIKGYDVSAKANLSAYADQSSASSWATEALAWAVGAGLISGRTSTTLAPDGIATRAEMAQIMMQFCEKVAK